MMRRRVFLGTTAAVMCATPAAVSAAAPQASAAADAPLPARFHLLVDARQPESVAAGVRAAHAANAVHELPARLDSAWACDLFGRLRREGASLRATTRPADQFLLRQLAFDLGFVPATEMQMSSSRVSLVQWTLVPRDPTP